MLTAFGDRLIPEIRSSLCLINKNPEHQDELVEFRNAIFKIYDNHASKHARYTFSAILFTLLDSKITKEKFQKTINYWYPQNCQLNRTLSKYLLIIYEMVISEESEKEINLFRKMLQIILFERAPNLSDAFKEEVKMRPTLPPTERINDRFGAYLSTKNSSAAKNSTAIFSSFDEQNSITASMSNTALLQKSVIIAHK